MNKNTVFSHKDYRRFLLDWVHSQPKRGHGKRAEMAVRLGTQSAFISQVLKGDAELSLEQADKLNTYLGHSTEEAQFFLLLVLENRAGTPTLRTHFRKQLEEILDARQSLKNRLKSAPELSPEDISIYFGSWYFAAVHVLISIPKFQTKPSIAQALGLPLEKVANILEFLVSKGLAEQSGDRFMTGDAHMHLGNDSSMIQKHHTNWRLRALASLDRETKGDLHYSSVVSISKKDVLKIRETLADCIASVKDKVSESQEETLYAFCVDFFEAASSHID